MQNLAPYISGSTSGEAGSGFSVHTGRGRSESFSCTNFDVCRNVTGTGSTLQPGDIYFFTEAGTGAIWTFDQIQHQTTTNPVNLRNQPLSAPAGGAGAGASGGGTAAFDPYAGAAPVRAETGHPAGGAGGAGSLQLDQALFEEIRKSVGRLLGSGHGTVHFAVRISNEGVVIDAMAKAGTASPEAKRRFRRALLGRRLFTPGPGAVSGTIDLPLVELSGGRL